MTANGEYSVVRTIDSQVKRSVNITLDSPRHTDLPGVCGLLGRPATLLVVCSPPGGLCVNQNINQPYQVVSIQCFIKPFHIQNLIHISYNLYIQLQIYMCNMMLKLNK